MVPVPTLNIKNEHVYELAKELSTRSGKSMTSVIEEALEQMLVRQQRRTPEEIIRDVQEIVRRTAPLLKDLEGDGTGDLYDEGWGLPQ